MGMRVTEFGRKRKSEKSGRNEEKEGGRKEDIVYRVRKSWTLSEFKLLQRCEGGGQILEAANTSTDRMMEQEHTQRAVDQPFLLGYLVLSPPTPKVGALPAQDTGLKEVSSTCPPCLMYRSTCCPHCQMMTIYLLAVVGLTSSAQFSTLKFARTTSTAAGDIGQALADETHSTKLLCRVAVVTFCWERVKLGANKYNKNCEWAIPDTSRRTVLHNRASARFELAILVCCVGVTLLGKQSGLTCLKEQKRSLWSQSLHFIHRQLYAVCED
ncbi:hypothetical protein RRG08_028189 [Elysia crispata]|uniref:Uncharacterized protein n=1 Tax=Elysia crispata TaxID=231223 RepID=A0AAE1EB64_9GAST|nr:hypothetical protein RRG08_028189 [Elysia crispata]